MLGHVSRSMLRPRRLNVGRRRLNLFETLEARVVLFNATGSVWASQQDITYGFMATGVQDSSNLDGGWQNVALAENGNLPSDVQSQIADAFRSWTKVANLGITQVADGGEAFGSTPAPAAIRIGSHAIDGVGGVPYHAFGPPPAADSRSGDIHFDTSDTFATSGQFYNTLVQSVGIALGLGTNNVPASVMNSVVPSTPIGPQLDDVRGIQVLYGPSVAVDLGLSAFDDPTPGNQSGDGSADDFRLVRRAEVIDGAGVVPSRSVDVVDMYVNGNLVRSVNWSTLSVLTITGSTDVDTLTIDFSGGDPLPSNQLVFQAGANVLTSDQVTLTGGNANLVNYSTQDAGTVHVTLDAKNLVFTGVDSIVNDFVNTETRFEALNEGSQEYHLISDGTPGNNTSIMTGVNLGYSSVLFRHPSEVFTVNAGPSDDNLFVEQLDETLVNPVQVNGGDGSDRFLIRPNTGVALDLNGGGPTVLGSGDILAVNLTGIISTSSPDFFTGLGTISSIGYRDVVFNGMESLITPDNYEPNNEMSDMTQLGSVPAVTLTNLSIHDDDDLHQHFDVDIFNYTAHAAGTLSVAAIFNNSRANLNLEIRDSSGSRVGTSETFAGREQVVIPVLAQQSFQIWVTPAAAGVNVTQYSLEVENFDLPQPALVSLSVSSDTGQSSQDGITFQTRPRILVQAGLHELNRGGVVTLLSPDQAQAGTLAGAAMQVIITNLATGALTTGYAQLIPEDGSGTQSNLLFGYTPPNDLAEGSYAITAAWRIFNGGGTSSSNLGPLADPLAAIIDTTAPGTSSGLDLLTSSDTGALNNDNITSMRQPVFTGAAPAGTRVNLFANGVLVGNGIANSAGTWEIETVTLKDAVYTFTVTVQDVAGNISETADSLQVEIDSTTPNTPYLDLIRDSDRGFREDDNITNDETLTFSMTTQDPGQADHINQFNYRFRLYLRAEDAALVLTGEEVLIYDSSTDLSIPLEDRQSGFTRSQLLQRTLASLPDGMHNFKLEVEDRAGNISNDFLLNVKIDTGIPPVAIDLTAVSDSGASNTDNVTRITTPTFVGTSMVGSRVRLFADGVQVGESLVGADATNNVLLDGLGQWQVTASSVADGIHAFVVRIETEAGNTAESAALQVEIDATAPNTPFLDLLASSDLGVRDNDDITSDSTPSVSMTSLDAGDSHLSAFNYQFKVFLRPNDAPPTVTGEERLVYDSSTDATILPADRVDGLIRTNFLSRTLATLPDGTHNLKLQAIDRAGNISNAFLLPITISTAAPSATIDLLDASDTGASSTDNVTRLSNTSYGGISTVGATVYLFANGQLVGQGTVGSDNTDGVANNGQGAWQINAQALSDGTYTMQVRVETLAGVAAVSPTLQMEVDTQAPNTPLLDLVSASDTGIRHDDNITSLSTPVVTMTSLDPNNATHLNPFNYQFRLFLRPEDAAAGVTGEERIIYDSSTDATIAPADLQDGLIRSNFLSRALAALPEGIHNLKLQAIDRAGNTSADFLLPIVIDAATPPATVDLLASSDTGSSSTDNITRLANTSYGGISTVGAKVSLFANGLLVGETTVGSDASDGTPGDGLGRWQIDASTLGDGVYSIQSRVETISGVSATSANLQVEVDTLIPNTPYLDLVTSSDTGINQYDNTTTDRTPTFTMTTEDPNQASHLNPFNYIFRLFVRSENAVAGGGKERLIYDSSTDATIPAANLNGGLTDLEILERTMAELGVGMHNFKLEVQDRAGNISDDFLLNVLILDNGNAGTITIDLVDASDSGANNQDNVTNINTPTFSGVAPLGSEIFLLADGQLIGKGFVAGDDSDGIVGNGIGTWFASTEALDDGVYDVVARAENLAGSVSLSNPLTVEIDTLVPNTPALDLVAASDSGRHDADNITNDTTLTVTMTTEDRAADEPHLFAQNFRFRVFVRPEATSVGVTGEETLVYDSGVDPTIPAANLLDSLTNLAFLQKTLGELPHGVHNFKLEVEDRAGNLSDDLLLTIEIDTQSPASTLLLDPTSDSGIVGVLSTLTDRITRDTTPLFYGATEADAVVRILIDGVAAGTTVAVPYDGNDAFPPPAGFTGNFKLESVVPLTDGAHTVQVFVEDRAGNGRTTPAATLNVMIDTQGPRVTNVVMGKVSVDGVFSVDGTSSVFAPKPTSGPDDLVSSIMVNFQDAPLRTSDFLYNALTQGSASSVGMFSLVGDANGAIPILRVIPTFTTVAGSLAVARVELVFHDPVDGILWNGNDLGAPLPDDRFTLRVSDRLTDPAGNALDGESNADAPFNGNDGDLATDPNLPSGDGIPGGGFTARFTIDSRPEVGVWSAGSVWVDINGNFVFDPQNPDASHRDIVYKTAFTSDDVFAGNFRDRNALVSDGFDKLAAYGRYAGSFRWIIDLNHDGAADLNVVDPANINGVPFAGNFSGTAGDGDEVGVFTGNRWYFDSNGDFQVDTSLATSMRGYPVIGDFDRDGFDDLATWSDDTFQIDLARGSLRGWDGVADQSFRFGFIGVRERPVAADMDSDGFDDLGLWVPDREGAAPREAGEWYFLVSAGTSILNRIQPALNPIRGLPEIPFSPVPFGHDIYAQFGDQFALPVVGNFDPPISKSPVTQSIGYTNPKNALDVNNDDFVSAMDALLIINDLNSTGARQLTGQGSASRYLDANGDGFVSAIDALLVINYLNQQSTLAQSAIAKSAAAANALPAPAAASVPASATQRGSASQHDVAIAASTSFSTSPGRTGEEIVIAQLATNRRKDRAQSAIDQVFSQEW